MFLGSSDPLKEIADPPLYGETRASCMECVEKHVGTAMILLSETKNGYPHYLLAVGHLHEAEEESQAWPDLASSIRSARKELQATGNVPDWDGVMECWRRIRHNSHTNKAIRIADRISICAKLHITGISPLTNRYHIA